MKSDTPKLKICGLQRPQDIEYVNLLHPDYIGFIFVPGRRRYLAPEQAVDLYRQLDRSITAVGVFINEPLSSLRRLLSLPCMDAIQLHGTEDENYLAAVRAMTDKPIIKAFSVHTPDDIRKAEASSADWILLDSASAGSGVSFDWSLLSAVKRPFFLAGGLNAGNLHAAIRQVHPYALDVSSGVETDHHKDFEKMREIVRILKSFS